MFIITALDKELSQMRYAETVNEDCRYVLEGPSLYTPGLLICLPLPLII
jgi:hypothetical protein